MSLPEDTIEAETLADLASYARNKGLDINQALRQLLEEQDKLRDFPEPMLQALSPKQRVVLQHLKSGLSVKEAANRLKVSEETVRTHIIRARNRLDCPDLLALRFQ